MAQPANALPGVENSKTIMGMIGQSIYGIIAQFITLLPNIVVGLVIFFLFWLIAKLIRHFSERFSSARHGAEVARVIGRLFYFALMLLGLLIAVTIIFPTMTVGKLVSILGIGSLAIGFAFKDIFENLLAGILILLRHPFRVGDEISSGKFTGTVEAIEMRATLIRTYDGLQIIIPNSNIYTEPVAVITAYNLLRSQYDLGIGYGDDIARAKQIALDTVRAIDGVVENPAPDVLTWELAGSAVNLRVRWWTLPKRPNVVKLRDEVLQKLKNALSEAGIDLPFPTQVVLFHDQTEETDGDRTQQREGWPAGEKPPQPLTIAGRINQLGKQDLEK
jgi:small conductance mechanosensitive channel